MLTETTCEWTPWENEADTVLSYVVPEGKIVSGFEFFQGSEKWVSPLFHTVYLLVAWRPSNMRVYVRDGSAQTILCAATLI